MQGVPLHGQSEILLASPTVHCTTQYETTHYTEYKETETEVGPGVNLCCIAPTAPQVCDTEYEKVCSTQYNTHCVDSVQTQCTTISVPKCTTQTNTVLKLSKYWVYCTVSCRFASSRCVRSSSPS